MPIYEYRCNSCHRRVQLFFRSFSSVGNAVCPHCQSTELGRVPSRVAQIRSDSSKEEMCLKLAMGGITEDELPGLPKNTRKWLNMSKRPTVDKAELISHYGDSYFPMKLRLLTDVIYSCSLGNNDGTPLKRMRAQLEQKEDSDQAIWDTIIDARTGEMTSRNHAKGTFH